MPHHVTDTVIDGKKIWVVYGSFFNSEPEARAAAQRLNDEEQQIQEDESERAKANRLGPVG